ncbi:MAG: Arc family DNA-binding protein [Clostridia bacterium]
MAIKSVSIRFEEEMLDKIAYIADYEGRSVNSHVLVLVRENISEFEKEHGKIEGTIAPEINVKPPRKN